MLKITLKMEKNMVRLTVRQSTEQQPERPRRMEIHMSEDAMTAAEFEAAFWTKPRLKRFD